MIWMLTALALAAPPASIDLDGDGKGEAVKLTDEGVKIGKHLIECYSDDGAACEVQEVDLTSADKQKEAVVCFMGPRDDKACRLYRLTGNELKQVDFGQWSQSAELRLTGSGFLYTTDWAHRLYYKVTKYQWTNGKMVGVPQPVYTAANPQTVHIEDTFKLHLAPNSSELVGNAKPDSDIAVLGEHGSEEGWLLVRLSSGITGYMLNTTLEKVSLHYRRTMQAG